MNTFYVWAIVITELLMIAMIIHVIHYSGFTRTQKKWYGLTFSAILFCSLAEFAVHCGYYDQAFKIPLTILTVLQFSVAPLLGVFFSGALGLKHQGKIAIIYFIFNLFIEVLSSPFGWVFYYDAEGYHRGSAFMIYISFYFISMAYLIATMAITGNKFNKRDILTIVMIIIILISGIIPMVFFRINITYTAIAVSASLCYIYYNDLVQQDTMANLVSNQNKLSGMQEHMISGLANLIENRDMETGEHIVRTSNYVRLLAEDCLKDGIYSDKIDDHFISLLTRLAPMHDIGKIIVSDTILKKPGKLTPEEFEEMKKHAAVGGDVVREVLSGITDEEYLSFASDIATYHHEKWNGKGYPNGIIGENIPLSARIMAIADVFDALISERCYKKAIPVDEAIKIIEEESGTHFDPNLVKVFLNHKDEFIKASKK